MNSQDAASTLSPHGKDPGSAAPSTTSNAAAVITSRALAAAKMRCLVAEESWSGRL